MYYILMDGAVVSDGSNKPREFSKKKKAENFIEGRRLQNAKVVTDISKHNSRIKVLL